MAVGGRLAEDRRAELQGLYDAAGRQVEAGAHYLGELLVGDHAGAVGVHVEPDGVFLDLILPGKSGVEILEDLRAVDPAVRVVVVTAVEQDEIDRRLADKGVKAILRKPFSFEDFKKLMKDLALP